MQHRKIGNDEWNPNFLNLQTQANWTRHPKPNGGQNDEMVWNGPSGQLLLLRWPPMQG